MARAVTVVGGGLAGCEAAWQLAERGHAVTLVEMRPVRATPVHRTGDLAELVCSNSMRGDAASNAVGVLKAEMEVLGSLIIRCARAAAVPAGGALAVDREAFSRLVTESVTGHPMISIERRELTGLPKRVRYNGKWLKPQEMLYLRAALNTGESLMKPPKGAYAQMLNRARRKIAAGERLSKAEVDRLCGDPSKAKAKLGWSPEVSFGGLVTMMVDADLALLAGRA